MSRPSITIGDRRVGADAPPFFLAEMSGNHNGSLARALEIVDAVAEAGAPAIKLQTYTADTITIDADTPNFRISDGHSLWGSRRLYELYGRVAASPREDHLAPLSGGEQILDAFLDPRRFRLIRS